LGSFEHERKAVSHRAVSKGPDAGEWTGSPLALLKRLQRTAGNRAVGDLLQSGVGGFIELMGLGAPAPRDVTDKMASDDYTHALGYVTRFYAGVRDQINLDSDARVEAEKAYRDFKDLKDPPTLGGEIILSVLKTALSLVPEGAIVARFLGAGEAANDLVSSIDWSTDTGDPFEDPDVRAERLRKKSDIDWGSEKGDPFEDPGERGKRKAEASKRRTEAGKTAVEHGYETVKQVKELAERRKAAREAESQAKEFAKLGEKRLSDKASALRRVEDEEELLTEWLFLVAGSDRLRGTMWKYVELHLGPVPKVSKELTNEVKWKYELVLYREHFGGAGGIASVVRTRYETPGAPDLVTSGELKGGPSQVTRRRVAFVAGLNSDDNSDEHTDDDTMIRVLEIGSVTKTERNPGLRKRGEY
jgi:hypothetical protein